MPEPSTTGTTLNYCLSEEKRKSFSEMKMTDGNKMTVKSLSEELEKIKLDVKEIHNLRK